MFCRRLCLLLAVSPVVAALGCGSGRAVPVSGVLHWEDGTPVTDATITFWPKAEGGRAASGFTGKDGAFELTTFNQGDGAIPGEYVVVVTKTSDLGEKFSPPGANADPKEMMKRMAEWAEKNRNRPKTTGREIPSRYQKADTSDLKWTVDGRTSDVKLKLKKG